MGYYPLTPPLRQAERLKETVRVQMTQTASGREQAELENRQKAAAERKRLSSAHGVFFVS